MRKRYITLFLVMVIVLACKKQENSVEPTVYEAPASGELTGRKCASDEVLQKQIESNPARGAFLEALERRTEKYSSGSMALRSGAKLYVPVVVHIVLSDNSIVTDAQIQSQIDVLNKDFNKTNSELSNPNVYLAGYQLANVANVNVEFVVTNVIRKNSSVASFGTNDAVKKSSSGGSDAVEPTAKLNMWVCDLSSGYLGYAQFPGGAAATDGVVIDYQAFGTNAATNYPSYTTFDLGRTATHEVGHWVNLRHIWGDRRCGNDYVGDTPAHDGSNGGCPSNTLRSSCQGKPMEQWMNYMDYTDDRCMYMFSGGQKTRIDAAIDGARLAYFNTTRP